MQTSVSSIRHHVHRHPSLVGSPRTPWTPVLELDSQRTVKAGGTVGLCDAIRRGADLRIRTDFVFNEHLDTRSNNSEPVVEVSDFRVTYLIEDRWAAGIMSQRMPIEPPEGFGPRASMSFFMYNQDGQQAIARPYLEAEKGTGPICAKHPPGRSGKLDLSPFPLRGPSALDDHTDMPKYRQLDNWDAGTNAPSSNFVYDFDLYRYLVCDAWEEVFSHTAEGHPVCGSLESLYEAFSQGCEVKVGIRGLCDDLVDGLASAHAPDHTVFVQAGPGYHCTERKLFSVGTQPVVRVRPGIPMRYASGGWDFGWLMVRTDGFVARWLCDPYTLRFQKSESRHAVRWFVR